MPLDTASFGFPVELSKVSHQLKKLWETEGQTKSRASILNFAVVGDSIGALEENTRIISQLVREHACRAFVVGVSPASEPKISAWIQAHCHLTKAGARQICSEQVTFLAEGCSEEAYANALLAHLDYDLPLTLWWQGELPHEPVSPLWRVVNRLLFDSRHWRDFASQLTALHHTKQANSQNLVWADLNWTRTLAMRQAFAQCFDAPDTLAQIEQLGSLHIEHAVHSRSTAILLASWFASQLGWIPLSSTASEIHFRSRTGKSIHCTLSSGGEIPLSRVILESASLKVTLEHPATYSLLHARLESVGQPPRESSFSAGPLDTPGLVALEMIPGSRHAVYQRSLALAQSIPGAALQAN